MNTTRQRRRTARFDVVAADGRRFSVDEFTTFVLVQPLSGPATPPKVAGVEFLHGPYPANENEDGTFDVFTGGRDPVRCRRA